LRYSGDDNWPTYHVAGIVRQFAVRNASGIDESAVGWGLSGVARVRSEANVFFAGLTGGSGLGDNLFGIDVAAVRFPTTGIRTFPTVGGYAGYSRLWLINPDHSPRLWSNVAYGIVHADLGPPTQLVDSNRLVQQTWVNLIYSLGENASLAMEYQYGMRETNARNEGDDHRFQVAVNVTTKGREERTSRRYSTRSVEVAPSRASLQRL
jgi:hypothetical protein